MLSVMCDVFQLQDVLFVDNDSPVKFSSEVVLYVDKYEIVWAACLMSHTMIMDDNCRIHCQPCNM